MGKVASNPTIRILMLGSAGVGKNCLESRFTTMTYPPPYNPALTLNSRRYFTLSPIHAAGDCEDDEASIADKTIDKKGAIVSTSERPGTSSTGATPRTPNTPPPVADLDTSSLDDCTLVASSVGSSLCSACARENNTYLVEIINYADLQSAATRKQVHAKADYDAVLLVYDVTASASFNAITSLHAEIPVCTRRNHHQHHRRAVPHASATRSRTSGWFGGGGNETGTTGSGEIVVGLVGNRCDVDDEEAAAAEDEVPISGSSHLTEDDLLHPLYRESILYEELMASCEARRKQAKTKKRSSEPPSSADADAAALREARKNDDIQKWLQISRPEPSLSSLTGEVFPKKAAPTTTTAAVKDTCQRQVSSADGEMLAQALQLPVPFLETSAKTGHHVERALENLVREVLREMGRDATGTNSAGKTCRHRVGKAAKDTKDKKDKDKLPAVHVEHAPHHHHFETLKSPPSHKAPVVHDVRGDAAPPSVHDIPLQRPESASMFRDAKNWTDGEGGQGVVVASPVSPVSPVQPVMPVQTTSPPIQRRESVIGRMRKVFWRKSQQEQHTADIAV